MHRPANDAATARQPLLPETEAAQAAFLNAVRLSDGSAADAAHTDLMRRRLEAAEAVDPACLLDRADELERWAETSSAAESFRREAAKLRTKANVIRSAMFAVAA